MPISLLALYLLTRGVIYSIYRRTPLPNTLGDSVFVAYDLSGKKLWERNIFLVGVTTNQIAISDSGVIYLAVNKGLTAFNPDGSIKFQDSDCALTAPRQPNIDSRGRIILQTGANGDIFACDPENGSRIYRTNFFPNGGSGAGNGGPAIDSHDVAYFHNQRGIQAVRSVDGSEVWRNSGLATTSAWKNYALSPDEKYLASSNQSGGSGFDMLTANTGVRLWHYTLGTASGVFTFGLHDRIYISADIRGSKLVDSNYLGDVCALENATGKEIWCFKTLSHLEQDNMVVDSSNAVYLNDNLETSLFGLKSDGLLLFKYIDPLGMPHTLIPAMADDGKLFYADNYLEGFRPWTLTASAEKRASVTGRDITFTVKSSMLRRDPQEGVAVDNQVQMRLDGGRIIPLHYLHQSGDDSVWEGTTAFLLTPIFLTSRLKVQWKRSPIKPPVP